MDRLRSRSSNEVRTPRRATGAGTRMTGRLVLLVTLAVASLALTQCRLVGDRLTGAHLGLLRRGGDCAEACQDQFKARNKAETDLHVDRVHACEGDQACMQAEQDRHLAAVQESKRLRDECLNGCHQQGGGGVGP